MARIGFLGLGAMGARMAANLIDAGHELTVWNRDGAKAAPLVAMGAQEAETPRAAAQDAEFVLAMLRDDDASRDVWTNPATGALAGMTAGAVAVECSTLGLDHIRWLASEVAARGPSFVDAPLAGSRPQAEARALVFFAGGAAEDVARVEPVLLATGSAVQHVGAAGAGMAVKLAVNSLFAVQVAVMAELTEMLAAAGLDPLAALGIVGTTPVCSPAARIAGEMMVRGAFAPMFPIQLVEKDLAYAVRAAGGATLAPMTEAARDRYRTAIDRGFGGDHLTGIVKTLR